MREPFAYQDMEHWTGAELVETVALIDSEDEASDFMDTYELACDDREHAEHNVHYIATQLLDDGSETLAVFGLEDFTPAVPGIRQWWSESSYGVKVEA